MKKVNVWYYFMIPVLILSLGSCKPKNDHDHPGMDEMKHYYKVYKGKITTEEVNRSEADSIFNYITFNDTIRKYFKNDNNIGRFKKDSNVKVYKYVRDNSSKLSFDVDKLGSDTVIVLINDSLTNHAEKATDKDGNPKGRGNMGCIPKFEQNAKNDLLFFRDNGSLYIPLMLADHKSAKDEIIYLLKNYNFKINDNDYINLNNLFKNNKLIEAGLDSTSTINPENKLIYLKIYKPGSVNADLTIEGIK